MKRWFVLNALLLIALALFLWWQNANDPNILYEEPLTVELKEEINHALIMQCDTKVNWEYAKNAYYGTINGCSIVRTPGKMDMMTIVGRMEIAGYMFEWWGSFGLHAYRDGGACELKEAYEKGWLTKEQIEVIHAKSHEYYAEKIRTVREAAGDTYINADPLSEQMEEEISGAFLTQHDIAVDWDYAYTFYGMISGCTIIMTTEQESAPKYCMQLISRCPFEWRTPFCLYAYRDGEVCALEKAYDKGWLTVSDIELIRERNVQYYAALYHS